MATPIKNMQLLQQLFQRPAQEFVKGQEAKTALALRLAQMQREEQLKREMMAREETLRRDLATQSYDKAIELAGLQGTREDARSTAYQTRADTMTQAADVKALRAKIAAEYAQYVKEAEALGETSRKLAEFEESWEGLGALQAERARIEQLRKDRDQSEIAAPAVQRIQQLRTAVATAKEELDTAKNPTADDFKLAEGRALKAVQGAISKGEFGTAKPPSADAQKKGLAAFATKDFKKAEAFLPALKTAYDAEYQRTLMGIKNSKSASQDALIAARNYDTALKTATAFEGSAWNAAGANRHLMKALSEMTPLERAMQPLPAPTLSAGQAAEAARPKTGGTGTPAPGGGAFTATGNPIADAYLKQHAEAQKEREGQSALIRLQQQIAERTQLERQLGGYRDPQAMALGAGTPYPTIIPAVDPRPAYANRLRELQQSIPPTPIIGVGGN